jgi:hypothetical protein
MTNKIEDYIKLAEGATEGPWITHGGKFFHGWQGDVFVFEKGKTVETGKHVVRCMNPLQVEQDKRETLSELDVIQKNNETAKAVEANAQFIAASRSIAPAMAKALIEAEDALKEAKVWISWSTDAPSGNDIQTQMAQALATIQRIKENG